MFARQKKFAKNIVTTFYSGIGSTQKLYVRFLQIFFTVLAVVAKGFNRKNRTLPVSKHPLKDLPRKRKIK